MRAGQFTFYIEIIPLVFASHAQAIPEKKLQYKKATVLSFPFLSSSQAPSDLSSQDRCPVRTKLLLTVAHTGQSKR